MNGIYFRKLCGYFIIIPILFLLLLPQCRKKESPVTVEQIEKKVRSHDTIQAEKVLTARTMGLAYLEENNLT